MSLLLPNLDDKPFAQLVEEARLLIPSTAPEWTDHNVHDPGITFVELFAWLAEIAQYRLNRTSAASYERFFSLMGLTPLAAQAAEVTVPFEFTALAQGLLIPANTRITAVGIDSIPFQTLRDQYLTKATVKRVVTHAGGREIVQTTAEKNEVGHYEALGLSPEVGDYLRVEFDEWFAEPQGQIQVNLFEDDLPPRKPLSKKAEGFEPSANIRWEYRSDSSGEPEEQWTELEVIHDGTLNLSRSGDLLFRSPSGQAANTHKVLRALVSGGRFEIPPRISSIRTNTVRARQVETVVNEPLGNEQNTKLLGQGLGTADQVVRLKNYPLFINPSIDDGPFQVGEVLDWRALIGRLREANELYDSPLKEIIIYLLSKLQSHADPDLNLSVPVGDPLRLQEYSFAAAFDELLSDDGFYQSSKFSSLGLPKEMLENASAGRCKKQNSTRRLNRLILQLLFPDLFVSDRLEVQVGLPAARVEEEVRTWRTWKRVDDFLKSGPDDDHYVLDADEGFIFFGNGLNGKIPQTSELIRARFYHYSQAEEGNLTAGHQWVLDFIPANTRTPKRANVTTAAGGKRKEALDDTKTRTREVFRKETAVLTGKDYESRTLNTPGLRVARVKVVPNFNPKLPELKLPGDVTVIVLPQPPPRNAFPNAAPPIPSSGFLDTIRNSLESRRVVTTNIHVIGPRYIEVSVACRVFLKKRVAEAEALESIKRTLTEFLDPVFGGPDAGRGWPFGRSIFPSEISRQLARVTGVDYVTNVAINDLKTGEALKLPYDGLPASGQHPITIVKFENRGASPDAKGNGSNCG